jgi:pleiotropic regulator 1
MSDSASIPIATNEQITSVSGHTSSLTTLIALNATLSNHLSFQPGKKRPRILVDECLRDPTSSFRFRSEYSSVAELPEAIRARSRRAEPTRRKQARNGGASSEGEGALNSSVDTPTPNSSPRSSISSTALVTTTRSAPNDSGVLNTTRSQSVQASRPSWHAPWKLMRVISGHLGWVRALTVEPGNQWFASGAGDRTIKIWDLASGSLRLTLTGHISTVRGLAVSARHPYLFSCGEDKMVKCWDLETNKVIRHYHGHLSGVYTLALHPTLDVLVTGGRDGVARVWDMRTRSNVIVLSGHTATVSDVKCQEADPQVISASLDSTVRLWDLAAGKAMAVLTHHKKGVRTMTTHPTEFTFATGSTGSIKQWKCPEGAFMQNFDGHNSIINTLSVNSSDVLFSGGM